LALLLGAPSRVLVTQGERFPKLHEQANSTPLLMSAITRIPAEIQ
jgi:hypothetical protein